MLTRSNDLNDWLNAFGSKQTAIWIEQIKTAKYEQMNGQIDLHGLLNGAHTSKKKPPTVVRHFYLPSLSRAVL